MVWFAASYAGAVLGFLGVNAAAGRWLGPDDFGFFIGTLAAAGLLSQLGLVGSHRSGLREVARLRDVDDPEAMAVLRNGVRAVSLTTLPLAALAGAAGVWFAADDAGTPTRVALAVALLLLVVLGGQQQLWANYVRGLGHVRFASMLEGRSGGALVAGLQAACVFVAWWAAPQWGLAGALLAVAVGFVVPVVSARAVVRRRWRGLSGPEPRLWRDLRLTVRRDWRFLSAQVATFLNLSTEIWIAGLLLTPVDTSMFSAGQRLALLLVLPLTALQVVLAPVVARAAAAHLDDNSLERLLRTGATVATALSVTLALPLFVAPGPVIELVYGPGFSAAVPVLVLVSLGSLGNVATGMAGTTLSMLGREDVAAKVQWQGAVLRWVVGVPAALTFGLPGLTVSALIVSAFVFTVMWWRTRRAVGVATHVTLRPELSLLRRTPG
ncbi:lipopolysaccharide biosynthesis protein [Nocardioides sp. GXQ0305]|uniref:lipopolysaccharide biosynthesis protein n=1 Tax=Nocardioides sp. GXQ0305 TaxID=3423912 RepID=UPI003D7D4382